VRSSAPMPRRADCFSADWVSGIRINVRRPRELPARVSPIPVFPAVPSTTVPPGSMSLRARPSSRRYFAARSLTEPPGFMNSHFPNTSQPVDSDALRSRISGVLPTASRKEFGLCMSRLCGIDRWPDSATSSIRCVKCARSGEPVRAHQGQRSGQCLPLSTSADRSLITAVSTGPVGRHRSSSWTRRSSRRCHRAVRGPPRANPCDPRVL